MSNLFLNIAMLGAFFTFTGRSFQNLAARTQKKFLDSSVLLNGISKLITPWLEFIALVFALVRFTILNHVLDSTESKSWTILNSWIRSALYLSSQVMAMTHLTCIFHITFQLTQISKF